MKFGGRNTFRIWIAHPLRNSRAFYFLLCFTDCLYNLFRPTCAVIVSPSSVGTHNNCAAVIEYLSFCFFLPPCIVHGFLFVYYSRRNNRYTRGVDVSVNRLWKILHEQRLPPVGYLLIPVIVIFFFFFLPSLFFFFFFFSGLSMMFSFLYMIFTSCWLLVRPPPLTYMRTARPPLTFTTREPSVGTVASPICLLCIHPTYYKGLLHMWEGYVRVQVWERARQEREVDRRAYGIRGTGF